MTYSAGVGQYVSDPLGEWLSGEGLKTLDALTHGSPDVVGVVDPELIIRYVNWVAPGLTREAVVGHSVFNLVPPEYTRATREAFDKVLETGSPASFETMYGTPNGIMIWNVRLGPIRLEGKVIGVFSLNTDVTELRREAADRDRFFALSRDVFIVVATDGRLTRVNPAFCEMLGYRVDEIVGRPFVDFVHPDDIGSSIERFSKRKAGAVGVYHYENRFRQRNGEFRLLSWSGIFDPLTDCIYGLARDVTDQRSTEIELRHAQRMEAVGHLAAGIAHDFNNLMQAVLANVEMGLKLESAPETVTTTLHEIGNITERASALTRQLLLFGRRAPLRRTPLDLNALIHELFHLLRSLLPESIAITHRLSEGRAKVSADKTQLEQVIINLCVNARDAMGNRGTLTIATDIVAIEEHQSELHPGAKPGRYVQLQVIDDGAGMTPETRERAFDPFFTTKDKYRGKGLGLATVYAIVKQHGGLIHVQSEVGQGSTFTLHLPCADVSSLAPRSDPAQESRPLGRSGTILVAEDDDLVRRPLIRALTESGYRTLAATNGQHAIDLFLEHSEAVDLVVLDVVMPQASGPEACERMRALRPDLPVIFISGYADPNTRERLPDDAEVLEKPFRISELHERIRRRLDS